MKTIDEVKDEIAQKHGYDNWISMLEYNVHSGIKNNTLSSYTDEAMQKYAELCCKHQIILCSNDLLSGNYKNFTEILAAGIIRLTKLATEL